MTVEDIGNVWEGSAELDRAGSNVTLTLFLRGV
jgi:hypothetical protein